MSEYLIQFNNISKFFGKVIALKDVTMRLKKGEIMCLLGDNGAGKSTLIKTLAGVHKSDEGEILANNLATISPALKNTITSRPKKSGASKSLVNHKDDHSIIMPIVAKLNINNIPKINIFFFGN